MLGIGGMGAVYQAWDAELGVSVAIKVIRPEVMADASAAAEVERRFKRELLLARQVTHKNVVRIHDLGEIDGIKYITMPYVDGADLSTILRREGRLPVPKVLRIRARRRLPASSRPIRSASSTAT
jgi:serine/threonine-protein kinase